MKNYSENELAGQEIDFERARTWRWPCAVSRVPRSVLKEFAAVRNPQFGDVALVEVVSIGTYDFVENSDGCNFSIFPGTIILGAFAPRYAPDELEGRIPEELKDGQLVALLNRGGVLGDVVSSNSQVGEPTMVRVLAFLRDRTGNIVNTKNYGKQTSPIPCSSAENDRNLIVVTGTSMSSGKSNTAKAITYSLTASGFRVVGAKVTGTAARRNSLLMRAAGAVEITDFTDYGYPSTYLLDEQEVIDLFWRIYNEMYEKAGPGGYIVLEIADGIYQRETRMILSNPQIKKQINHLMFSCCDSLSAVAGVQTLQRSFGLRTTAISGPAANSELGLKEVAQFLGPMSAFNNMVMDVPYICDLFAEPAAAEGAHTGQHAALVVVNKDEDTELLPDKNSFIIPKIPGSRKEF